MSFSAIEERAHEIDLAALRGPTPTGIYFLLNRDELVYIGQSENVPQRVGAHVALNDKPFTRAFWIPVARAELDAHEAAFIRRFAPRENYRAPAVDRDVEILARFGLSPSREAMDAFSIRRLSRYRPKEWPRRKSQQPSARRARRARQRRRLRAALWVAITQLSAA